MAISVGSDGDGLPFSALTDAADQADLLGFLRRLYSLGLPLVSVDYVGYG